MLPRSGTNDHAHGAVSRPVATSSATPAPHRPVLPREGSTGEADSRTPGGCGCTGADFNSDTVFPRAKVDTPSGQRDRPKGGSPLLARLQPLGGGSVKACTTATDGLAAPWAIGIGARLERPVCCSPVVRPMMSCLGPTCCCSTVPTGFTTGTPGLCLVGPSIPGRQPGTPPCARWRRRPGSI